jgi:MFS family permease
MGFTLVMPFLPLYFHQLGVESVGEVAMWSGLSLGVTPALTAALSPFWGRLADRYGRKIMVERSLGSFVIIMAATAFVTRAWHVFALRAIQGLFAGYGSLTLTMGADSAPEGRMAQSIGLVQTAQRLGPALGPVFGGTLAALVGLRHSFLVAALFYALAVVLVFVMYDESLVHAHAVEQKDTGGAVTFRNVLAFENFLVMSAVIFAFQFVDRSFGPVLPLYVGLLGVPASRAAFISGILFSVAAGAGALGHHYCAALLRRMRASRLIVLASIAAGSGATMYAVSPSVWWLYGATPLFGLAIGAGMTASYTAAAEVIPPNARGIGFGLLTTASLVGMAASPVVAGFLGAWSLRAVFALDAVALGALAFGVTLAARAISAESAVARESE